MSDVIVYPTWAGRESRHPTPTPSWMAPPLAESRIETREVPPVRVSILPVDSARLKPSLHPVVEPPPPSPRLPSQPPAPAYPDLRAECSELQAQLKAAVDALADLRRVVLEASEPQLVRLACAIGERIAGQELAVRPELVVGWARAAIERLATDGSVVVAVSTDLAASLDEAAWAPVRSASVRIECDAALAPRSCEVRSASSSVDASLAGRAEAIVREVTGGTT